MSKQLIHCTDGMIDLILNNWFKVKLEDFVWGDNHKEWLEENIEGNWYGLIRVYNGYLIYFSNENDIMLYSLTWL
jgi:hypothetical protein